MIEWRIGCPGFHYKEWREVFYPKGVPQSKWFEYYNEHFNTIELNTTFYRFPQVRFLKNWYDKSVEDFLFSVKVPRLITHYKQLKDCKRMLSDFYGTCLEGLGMKLGCVLFQLPARIEYSEAVLERIIENADPSFVNVVEFRHDTWWKPAIYKSLKENQLHFCSISINKLPDKVIPSQLVYYRFHGVPTLYKSQYKKEKIIEVADQIISNKKISKAFVYFNNTWGVGAIRNARQMQKYVDAHLQSAKVSA